MGHANVSWIQQTGKNNARNRIYLLTPRAQVGNWVPCLKQRGAQGKAEAAQQYDHSKEPANSGQRGRHRADHGEELTGERQGQIS